jgi:hypothetical protein
MNALHSLSPDAVISRSIDLLEAEMDGEVVLLSVAGGRYYGLDDIGSDIWRRLEAPRRLADLTAALLEDYDAPVDTLQDDLLSLLDQMQAEGLIAIAA